MTTLPQEAVSEYLSSVIQEEEAITLEDITTLSSIVYDHNNEIKSIRTTLDDQLAKYLSLQLKVDELLTQVIELNQRVIDHIREQLADEPVPDTEPSATTVSNELPVSPDTTTLP